MDIEGEFTRKFDRDFLKKRDGLSDEEWREKREGMKLSEKQSAVEAELEKVAARIERRRGFLLKRFDSIKEIEDPKIRGMKFEFGRTDKVPYEATLELTCKTNETYQAVFVDWAMEVIGKAPSKKDYVTFGIDRVDLQKVDHFIEEKLLEFAEAYVE